MNHEQHPYHLIPQLNRIAINTKTNQHHLSKSTPHNREELNQALDRMKSVHPGLKLSSEQKIDFTRYCLLIEQVIYCANNQAKPSKYFDEATAKLTWDATTDQENDFQNHPLDELSKLAIQGDWQPILNSIADHLGSNKHIQNNHSPLNGATIALSLYTSVIEYHQSLIKQAA